MLGSPTRLCRHFFEQHMKSRLAVFSNGFFTAKPLLKTANRLLLPAANKTNFKSYMEPATKKQRFSNLSSTEIQLLIEKKDSENTQKVTKNAVATLLAFCNKISPNESSPRDDKYLEELSSEELNELLTAFYPNAWGKNGENYKKSALMGLRFGLQRHFLFKKNVNIISDQEFSKSNQVYEAIMVEYIKP